MTYKYHWTYTMSKDIEIESEHENDYESTYYAAQEKAKEMGLDMINGRIDDDDCWIE